MQYKTLATLLFATAVLAAPQPQETSGSSSSSSTGDYSDSSDSSYDYSDYADYEDIPTSIEAVIETAIPTTWLESFYTNEAFYSSEVAAMAKGDWPAWISSMPSDARSWATSMLQEELSALTATDIFVSETESSTQVFPMYTPTLGGASATATASGSVTHVTGTKSSSQTTSTGSSDASSTDSASSSAGAHSSSAAASSTSTGGSPAATGTIAMGLAGAAGILGVALAL